VGGVLRDAQPLTSETPFLLVVVVLVLVVVVVLVLVLGRRGGEIEHEHDDDDDDFKGRKLLDLCHFSSV
jgi:hypothetical protein